VRNAFARAPVPPLSSTAAAAFARCQSSSARSAIWIGMRGRTALPAKPSCPVDPEDSFQGLSAGARSFGEPPPKAARIRVTVGRIPRSARAWAAAATRCRRASLRAALPALELEAAREAAEAVRQGQSRGVHLARL
jgi:hypothetical protein